MRPHISSGRRLATSGLAALALVLGVLAACATAPPAAMMQEPAGQQQFVLRLSAGQCADLAIAPGQITETVTPSISASPPFAVYTFALQFDGSLLEIQEQPHAVVIETQAGDVSEVFACGDVPTGSAMAEPVIGLVATGSDALVGTAILRQPAEGRVEVIAYLLLDAGGSEDAIPGGTPNPDPDIDPEDDDEDEGV